MHILIINGPNLHNIGSRETDIYGELNFNDFLESLKKDFPDIKISYFQTHIEGEIVSKLHFADNEKYDGVVLNAGAYSHSSVAIRDAILSIKIPVIKVHISNIYAREPFRQKNVIAGVCNGIITGFGLNSYRLAVLGLPGKKQ